MNRPQRRGSRRPAQAIAVAAAGFFALVISPSGAAASTMTPGPGDCQWHAGITCPFPWPIDTVAGHALVADGFGGSGRGDVIDATKLVPAPARGTEVR